MNAALHHSHQQQQQQQQQQQRHDHHHHPCDGTHTTSEATYTQFSEPAAPGRHGHGADVDDGDDARSASSRTSYTSTTDGIDVLGSAKPAPSNPAEWSRWHAARIVTTVSFKRTVLLLILASTGLLAARTTDLVRYGDENDDNTVLDAINGTLRLLLVAFTVEVIVSIACYQEHVQSMGWLAADVAVVLLVWWTNDLSLLVLRAFRLLRALRKASGFPALKWATKAVLRVLPRLAAVLGVLVPGVFAIFAILFTNLYQDAELYGGDDTGGNNPLLSEDYFGRLDVSALTLFQIMTGGRNWSVVTNELQAQYPSAWLPMVCFVIVSLFVFGSLIIAIVCDAVSTVNADRLWKSLDHDARAATSTTGDAGHLFGGESLYAAPLHPPPPPLPSRGGGGGSAGTEWKQMRQKLDDLANTVDTLVRLQRACQESLNALTQRDTARQLLQSQQQQPIRSTSSLSSSPGIVMAHSDERNDPVKTRR